MKELTLAAGIPAKYLEEVVKADELLNTEILQERLDFLEEVHSGPYTALVKVWSLVPPATWEMYRLLGQTRLTEQVLLRKKQRVLRKAWSDRYGRAG